MSDERERLIADLRMEMPGGELLSPLVADYILARDAKRERDVSEFRCSCGAAASKLSYASDLCICPRPSDARARELRIAEAVRDAAADITQNAAPHRLDLAAIIASIDAAGEERT